MRLEPRGSHSFTEEERQVFIDRWRESGLKQADFCQQHGIALNAFKQWTKTQGKSEPSLLPVTTISADQSPSSKDEYDFCITLRSGLSCRFNAGIEAVVKFIKGIESCN